jgi:putative peptide zinc metalloprotease protein
LRLQEGTELLGRYEGSAYERPTYLVRRKDGQVVHLSHLLYLVASLMDGERGFTEIAEGLTLELGQHVVADNVEYLIEKKLRPSGLIAGSADDDQAPVLTRSLPLLALRYRRRVIPARLHRGVTTALQPLFWPPIVVLMVAGLVAANILLFGADRTALTQAARQLPFHPNLFLLVTVLVIFSGFFHELGHATGTRYGGGSPGVMGVGIYLAWPAFYTDLTDSYRLNRSGRLRSDLGGLYFNAVLIVAAGIAYVATGFGPLGAWVSIRN